MQVTDGAELVSDTVSGANAARETAGRTECSGCVVDVAGGEFGGEERITVLSSAGGFR